MMNRCEDDPDRADLLAFQQDDHRRHLEALWKRRADEAWRLALYVCGEKADDALQEAALALVTHANRWRDRGPGSATAWLMTIVANAARMQRRSDRAQMTSLESPDCLVDEVEDHPPYEQIKQAQLQLSRLPERYRSAVQLRYMSGLSFSAVAAVLSVPERTARTRVSRGLDLLRKRLGIARPVGVSGLLIWLTPSVLPAAPSGLTTLPLLPAVPAAQAASVMSSAAAVLPTASGISMQATAVAVAVIATVGMVLPSVFPASLPVKVEQLSDQLGENAANAVGWQVPQGADPAAVAVLQAPMSLRVNRAGLADVWELIDLHLPTNSAMTWLFRAGGEPAWNAGESNLVLTDGPEAFPAVTIDIAAPLWQVLDEVSDQVDLAWSLRGAVVHIHRQPDPQAAAGWRDSRIEMRERHRLAARSVAAGDDAALHFLVRESLLKERESSHATAVLHRLEGDRLPLIRSDAGWHQVSLYSLLADADDLAKIWAERSKKETNVPGDDWMRIVAQQAAWPSAVDDFWQNPNKTWISAGFSSTKYHPEIISRIQRFNEGETIDMSWPLVSARPLVGQERLLRDALARCQQENFAILPYLLKALLRLRPSIAEELSLEYTAHPERLQRAWRAVRTSQVVESILPQLSPTVASAVFPTDYNNRWMLLGARLRILAIRYPGNTTPDWAQAMLDMKSPFITRALSINMVNRWPQEAQGLLLQQLPDIDPALPKVPRALGRLLTPEGLPEIERAVAAMGQSEVWRERIMLLIMAGMEHNSLVDRAKQGLFSSDRLLQQTAAEVLVSSRQLTPKVLLEVLPQEELPYFSRFILTAGVQHHLPHQGLTSWLLRQDHIAADARRVFSPMPGLLSGGILDGLKMVVLYGSAEQVQKATAYIDRYAIDTNQYEAWSRRMVTTIRDLGLSRQAVPVILQPAEDVPQQDREVPFF